MNTRNKTPSKYVYYGLHLYFSGLSLRKTSERLSQIYKRNHVTIWNWIQKYKPLKIQARKRKILEYIVDETMLKVGSEYIWLWVAIEPKNRQILALLLLKISKERNMFVAERFIGGLVKFNGKHPVSTDGGTWYPMACKFLGFKHHNHSPYEKSIIERTMQYIKDRTESFDDYFPCRVKNCKLNHVRNWLRLFVDYYNMEIKPIK
ncbi:MAG: DDE-type integrase/transposase/recombinase [Candidatus Nitrosocosmicus sp.]|nr:DDE-type integrase/transposase/recombinase [Candidatus Nitrosocosmicus sp.]